jgi:hypothetical protein
MSYFSSTQFTGPTPQHPVSPCKCGAQPRLVGKMLDTQHGGIVRMFECQCGERSWTEDKE